MQDMNHEAVVKDVMLPLYNAKFWMKLMGVVLIIQGVLTVFATFGIGLLVAWLPIWLGVLLFQSAGGIENAYERGDGEAAARSLDKLKLFFIINGVVLLIMIIIAAVVFLFFGSMLGGMMAQYGAGGTGGLLF